MDDMLDINELKKTLENFARVRDWEKFHNPKNLAMALASETGELLEIFRWLNEHEAIDIKNHPEIKTAVSHELADIMLNLIRIADILEINLDTAITAKIQINDSHYPVDKVKGSAKKYTL